MNSVKSLKNSVLNYLVDPFIAGIHGYLLFIAILACIKFMIFVFSYHNSFSISLSDVLIAILGFVIAFSMRCYSNKCEPA